MPNDVAKPFHAREFATLTTRVQQEIERRILTGEIKAGDRITESALADSLGVSRGPVREAMRWLAQAGLVDLVANKGAIVRSLGIDEAVNLYQVRGAIFALACEGLARERSAETLAQLQHNMAEMEKAYRDDDTETYYRLNVEFHAAILRGCGNPRARRIYEDIVKEMHLFRRRGLSRVPNIAASLSEHAAIVAAAVAGDPEAAREAGRRHVDNGRERFLATLHEDPDREAAAEQRRM